VLTTGGFCFSGNFFYICVDVDDVEGTYILGFAACCVLSFCLSFFLNCMLLYLFFFNCMLFFY